ncbi:MAG: DUF4382 domain-containing protein [Bacteroidota bacterium]
MKLRLMGLFLVASIAFVACKKDSADAENSNLRIRMTDAPLDVDAVNIDLQSVVVKFDKEDSDWLPLTTLPGIYNLLALQNGVDTLIAHGVFPVVRFVKEIRLIVGSNNTVVVNGQVFPLTIPSGSESGLKIKIDKQLRAPIETLLIDFDAALSIKLEPNGYKLRPVVKLK